jgi:Flp pilus assembly pilin Flp
MNFVIRTFVKIRERRGQSMTEYALIMAAIAVAVYASYQTLGNSIKNTVGNVTNSL